MAPSGVGGNEYYPTEAAYLDAVAHALHEEYAAIVAAGFTLQVDDPFLTDVFSYGTGTRQDTLEKAQRYVDAINRSLRGIPPERVRLHTCYGINEGPSADCGFSSQATYRPEIHPAIVWAKFEALAEGARRASARLWR